MDQAIAQALWWIGFFIVLVIAIYFARIGIQTLFDMYAPPSAEEISLREAESAAKQATKEFKRRKRVRSFRFF